MTQNILSLFIKPILELFKSAASMIIGIIVFVALGLGIYIFQSHLAYQVVYIGLTFDLMLIGGLVTKLTVLKPEISKYQAILNEINALLDPEKIGSRNLTLSPKDEKIRGLVEKGLNLNKK